METIPITQRSDEVQETAQPQEVSSVSESRQMLKSLPVSLSTAEVREVSEELAEKMNKVSSVFNTKLSFTVDNATGKTIIKVVDSETDEVIRQIPPEHMLHLVSRMRDVMGMVLNIEI